MPPPVGYEKFQVGVSHIGMAYIYPWVDIPNMATCLPCPCRSDAWIWCKVAYMKMMKARYPSPYY